MRHYLLFVLICFSASSLLAQYKYVAVYPDLQGNALYESVKSNYRPASVLDYAVARDTLFLRIDAVERNLSCIYTGLTLNIPEGQDPTQAVFLNGIANGINTEHVYPLSLGTENTNAQSDMHHLFPSKVKTNSDRGNLAYGESPDFATMRWYKNTSELTSIPTDNKDDYSELGSNGLFEPRESVKGDIARALFYIFTIYRNEVTSVNNTFFESQRETICNWHNQDPVDEKEWIRSQKIAFYQDGKPNPFVLDCSLAARMYCDKVSSFCSQLAINDLPQTKYELGYFDASSNTFVINEGLSGLITITDVMGKNYISAMLPLLNEKQFLPINGLATGMYVANLKMENKGKNISLLFFTQ